MSYAILIPASSTSKRLPGKNFMRFNGKPLIQYTIDFAKKFEYPIYISTDIKDYKALGCTTIVRPFGSEVDMEIVVHHAAIKIKEDNIILLQVTSPIRKKTVVDKCIMKFEQFAEFEAHSINVVTVDRRSLKPNGYCFVFPKNRYIWNSELYLIMMEREIDIDYIWDFRIGEAIMKGSFDKWRS